MSGIQDFLKFLSTFTKIDFSGREAELGSFVQKYDKDKNSIFDSNELSAIIDDLSVFKSNDATETSNVDSFVSNLTTIGRQNKEDIIKKYLDETGSNREFPLKNKYEMNFLMTLNNEQLERAGKFLFFIENRKEQFGWLDIIRLSDLNDEEFERAKELLYVKNRQEQFNSLGIESLAKLDDEEFERANKLFFIENRQKQFNGEEIAILTKLDDEEFERANKLFFIENRDKQFNGNEIVQIAQLKDEDFEHAKQLFYIENKNKQFSGEEIEKLAKLEDEDFKWISKYFNYNNLTSDDMILLTKYRSKELEEDMNSTFSDSCAVKKLRTGELKVKIYSDNNVDRYNVYEKTGIVETIESKKLPDTESIANGNKITCYNKKLKVKQETIIGDIPNTDDKNIVFSEVLTYFDDDGNVVRTVTAKRNPENGALNVSQTDKNGEPILPPIQWENVDPDTGATITERHLTSPDGTKTDCYFKENDKLKVSDYKITDKDGNILINVHQTFEQVSDNKFISSILATEDPKDTQIYEMEYTDDGKVIIFDKKNNKTTELELDKIKACRGTNLEVLMPTIRKLPGQILLEIIKKHIQIESRPKLLAILYGSKTFAKAEGRVIHIGNYDDTVGKEENALGIIIHEIAHAMDANINDELPTGKDDLFSDNQEIKKIYQEEEELLFKYATTEQQAHIDYLLSDFHEIVADVHSLLYSKDEPLLNTRRLYLAQYFPRTVAAIMKAMLEEEGVKV